MIFSEQLGALLVAILTVGFGVTWAVVEMRNLRRWRQMRREGHDVRDQVFGSWMMILVTVGAIAGVVLHNVR